MALATAPAAGEPGAAASATGNASARIIAPLKLVAVEPLEFGTAATPIDGGGSISVVPSGGSITFSGSLASDCNDTARCTARPARFEVRGEPGRYYRVAYPARAQADPVGVPAPALLISAISLAFKSTGAGGSRGVLDFDGRDGFALGGTLEIPGGTPAGFYRATLAVVVSYD